MHDTVVWPVHIPAVRLVQNNATKCNSIARPCILFLSSAHPTRSIYWMAKQDGRRTHEFALNVFGWFHRLRSVEPNAENPLGHIAIMDNTCNAVHSFWRDRNMQYFFMCTDGTLLSAANL